MRSLAAIAVLLLISDTNADWSEQPVGRLQGKSATAFSIMRDNERDIARFVDEAYGYAIFPGITRVALGFGGAHGMGVVVRNDTVIGRASCWQFSSGIQAGAKYFTMMIFFKEKEDLERFTAGTAELMGQAGVTALAVSADATPAYDKGVAVFARSKFGLMAEFSISGARFNYKPLPSTTEADR